MTPREIDALVAEKVMGEKAVADEATWDSETWKLNGPIFGPKPYSTDMACAWLVMEKLHAYNPFWECPAGNENFPGIDLSPTIPRGWHCNFGDDTTHAYADTAPMAICKAALKAVGIEVP